MLNRFSISYRSVCLAIWLLNCTIPLSKIIIALAFIGNLAGLSDRSVTLTFGKIFILMSLLS